MTAFWTGFAKQADLKEDVELKPHQVRARNKLQRTGGLLAYHSLGSGKTLTSLASTQGKKTDVVVPASLRTNYAKEVKTFTKGHHPNIMSFEKAVATPKDKGTESLVIDEAHNMGRTESARSQEMVNRSSEYKQRLLLTGTPIRNHPSELAPLMAVARGDRKIPTDPKTFSDRFIQEKKVNPNILARVFRGAKPGIKYKMKNRKEFEKLVDGYVDYYKADQKDFPSVSHETIAIPMGGEQLNYYNYVLNKASPGLRYKIKRGLPPSKTESKQLNAFLSGARQVSNSTASFGGKELSPKLQRAVDELSSRHGKDPNFKAVVYSNYLDSGVKSYAKALDAKGIPYVIFDGSLNDTKRQEAVRAYNAGEVKALLLSGAGAQGLDLKGTKLVQLLEPHWNNPRLEQAIGRAVRYKSHSHLPEDEQHVHVQRYHSTLPKTFFQRLFHKDEDKSVDQYLDTLSKDKEALNEQFLSVLRNVGSRK